ncbi:MAG: type II toxin-antitoxin system VapC family toxin [Candidatus Omnitrophota bacterium]
MRILHLDTHAALWLYAGEVELFPDRVRAWLEQSPLYISPMVLLEIQYLKELGKINVKVDTFLRDIHDDLGLEISKAGFAAVAIEAVKLSWTRDPFDRMIVAQALADDARLITRDKTILKYCRQACWQ